jgi:hypothetical protein
MSQGRQLRFVEDLTKDDSDDEDDSDQVQMMPPIPLQRSSCVDAFDPYTTPEKQKRKHACSLCNCKRTKK